MALIKLKLPDGNVLSFEEGITGADVARSIGEGLARVAIAVQLDGASLDLSAPIPHSGDFRVLTFDDDEGKHIFWHSSAHIMAEAVLRLFPGTKVAIGPAIEQGFYYDFDRDEPFTFEDLAAIEAEMKKIIKEGRAFQRCELARDEAVERFEKAGEVYKVELVGEIPLGETVSLYTSGGFTDLCRGPHVPDASRIKAFKLLSVAGAYWRGSEKNKMLQRLYGISFPKKAMLDEYIEKLEQAKARDHRKLGKELDLFSISDEIGPGLVLWHPNGAVIREVIEDYWRRRHREEGYLPVYTPIVGRAKIWETSGHLGFYNDNMYPPMIFEEGEQYFVRPMNCPFHIAIYRTQLRSYRDLPIRYCELGNDYRYERSGVLHGLLRVRGFTMDDAHIFCTPEQMIDEATGVYEFSLGMLRAFGFKEFGIYLSTRPEKFVGEVERWEKATEALEIALERVGLPWKVDDGGGAFYGPKIDIKVRDAIGREWQTTTVQFDFNEPERFDIYYIDENGEKAKPYMVHRALLGSLERFFACLVEHYAGNFPMWLAPVQAVVIPVSEKFAEYAKSVHQKLLKAQIRASLDNRPETIGYRIREAETSKVPFMLIVGERETESNSASLRSHADGDLGSMSLEEIIDKFNMEKNPPN
ncbi:MAG TPA: threonine--tRNA ligase [candidate division Zixibacteria bacterium]|nr:threonine--tRNA ligase [candidate division Zixibacteria bacterium]